MADTKKIVEYEIHGNTTNLEKELKMAINNMNTLETKMQNVATAPYARGNKNFAAFGRIASIEKTLAKIREMQAKLQSAEITAVTPDQLALIKVMNEELQKYIDKITNAKKINDLSTVQMKKMQEAVYDMAYTLKKSGVTAVETFSDKLKASASKIAAVAVAIRMAIRYIEKLYSASADFAETMNLFNVAVKDANKELTDFVETMSNAFGLDPEPLYRATAIFKQLANTLGDASDATNVFTKGATQLVYDLSSLYNVDVDTMLQAFKSGLTGMTKPLMKYGISVHQATIEEVALRHGIAKTYKEMNEAEKMYMRYIAILDQTATAQGDMAKTLESPANQLRVARDQLEMLTRNLGNFVVMVSKLVMPAFNGIVKGINAVLVALNKAAGYEIVDYSDNLSSNNQMLDEGTDSIEEYENALSGLLAPLDEINQASSNQAKQSFATVDPSIIAQLGSYDNLMNRITTTSQKFADIFNAVFNPQIFTALGQTINTAFTLIDASVTAVANSLQAVSPIINLLTTGVGYLLTGVTWLIDKAFAPLQLWLEGVTSNIWTLIGAFAALNLIQAAYTGSLSSMIAVKAATWFASTTKQIILNTAALLKNAAAWVVNTAKVIANTIANWWNNASLIAKIGLLTMGAGLVLVPIILAATGVFSSKANEVPKMAKGGVVTGPTYAMIGEGKYNEAVIPLGRSPQMQELKNDIANEVSRKNSPTPRRAQRGSESQTPIILQVSGRELGRTSITNIGLVKRQIGVDLG